MQHNVQTLLHVVKRIPLAAGRELLRMCFRLFLSPKIFKISIKSLNISHPCNIIVTQCRWSACFNSPTPLGSLYLPPHSVTLRSLSSKKYHQDDVRGLEIFQIKIIENGFPSTISQNYQVKLILTMQSMLIKGPFH